MNVFLIFVAVLALFIADVLTPIFILRFKNAKFSKQSLQNDEKILSIAKTHWFVLLKTVLAQLLISVVFIPILVSLFKENIIGDGIVVFSIIGLIFLFYLRKQVLYCLREFVITDKRILFKFGILSRTTSEFRFEKVESCDVEQGVLGRIFGFGSIIIVAMVRSVRVKISSVSLLTWISYRLAMAGKMIHLPLSQREIVYMAVVLLMIRELP